MKKRILRLSVKKIYFNQIKSREKLDEYRLATSFWSQRLLGREYDEIVVCCGYPKKGDTDRELYFKWIGAPILKGFQHKHFGPRKYTVFAINLREPL